MSQLVNKNLITLKCVLFCFLSGVGCIFPFLPLHMLSLGLSKGEARVISAVAPCVALLGPLILGPLVDKLSVGRGSTGGSSASSGSGKLLRTLTALCLILSAIFYSLLLAVPYTERHEARRPNVMFMCDEDNAYVMQEMCTEGMRCNQWSGEKKGVLAVGYCEYGCAEDGRSWLTSPYNITPTTTTIRPMYLTVINYTQPLEALAAEDADGEEYEEFPPHICSEENCLVYMQHQERLRVPLSLIDANPDDNSTSDDNWCTYKTGNPVTKCPVRSTNASILEKGGCRPAVRCLVLDPYDEPDTVLANAECRRIIGDPTYTVLSYSVIRVLSDIWPTAALALLGAACVIATRETSLGRGDVGRQLAFGTLGLAIFPPLAGLAVDQMPDTGYLVPFVMHAIFMLIGALILLVDSGMPLSTPEWWWHTSTGVLAVPMSAVRRYGAEIAALCAVIALLGVLWSGIDSYLPWTVQELNGTATQMGLTLTAGALPAVPALFWAETVVDYIGHSNLFISALVFYSIRYTGLAYTTDYTWVAVCEILEVFTLSLVWVAAILYFRHLVPRKYTTTGQALPVVSHFCIGRCIGAIIGSLVSLDMGAMPAQTLHRGLASLAMIAAAIYAGLYHLMLAPRCAAPAAPPPPQLLQGLNANGASNGSYSPMRVYHEERSRKGQFRY